MDFYFYTSLIMMGIATIIFCWAQIIAMRSTHAKYENKILKRKLSDSIARGQENE